MRFGIDPDSGKGISAEEYKQKDGSKTAEIGDTFKQPDAICKACRNAIYLVGGSPDRVLHFRHRLGSFCPTKFPTGKPYLELTPTDGDPASGALLRAAVKRNWKAHYIALRAMVPYFSPEEFVALLQFASEQRTWDYRGLCEEEVPYVLVLVADFPPWTSTREGGRHQRELWFRFWYSSKVRALSDLWIRPQETPILFRGSFVPPSRRGGRPRYEDLLRDKPMDRDYDFLMRPAPRLPSFISNYVDEWLLRSRYFQ